MNEEVINDTLVSINTVNSTTYVLLISLLLICLYLFTNKNNILKGGSSPIISLNSILTRMVNVLVIITLVMGIFTFPILFYAGLLFYVLQNYMLPFMKRI